MNWNNASRQCCLIFDVNKRMSENGSLNSHGMQSILFYQITWFNSFQMQIKIRTNYSPKCTTTTTSTPNKHTMGRIQSSVKSSRLMNRSIGRFTHKKNHLPLWSLLQTGLVMISMVKKNGKTPHFLK